ncbi:WAT1-related protein [Melia azedarach]|uniref:WAT1-related protein n=1 Tax=Melia azedarach TaxID=155640 RepID=A0ACC1XDR8_MELAZ|nr:WAT1-related protein [Melia azedarach]
MSVKSLSHLLNHGKTYLCVLFMQFTYSIMSIMAKYAFTRGLSPHVLVAYRMVVATILIAPFAFVLERKTRPKMTLALFLKIALLSFFEPTISQNLYYSGMKYTTAAFTTAMCNILPAITFLMACIFGLEKVNIKRVHSQAKILGTIFAAGGAMTMTLLKGPILEFPWKPLRILHYQSQNVTHKEDHTKGSLMIIAGCFCWSCFIILQAFLLRSYPAELSLAALICMISSIEGTILAFVVERGNTAVWSLQFDAKLLTIVYGGFVSCTAYFIMGWLMKKRGPVFVSSFNPLGTVITAILGSLFLAEQLYVGRIVGAIVIVIGLYMVLWGRSKDQQPSKSYSNHMAQSDQQMASINRDIDIENTST